MERPVTRESISFARTIHALYRSWTAASFVAIDGRTMAAALMLGAEVQMGTAFIATKAAVHERYKACIVRAKDIDSRVTGRSTGHQCGRFIIR